MFWFLTSGFRLRTFLDIEKDKILTTVQKKKKEGKRRTIWKRESFWQKIDVIIP